MSNAIHETAEAITLTIKVIPRAKRDEVVGVENDVVKIRLNAPPVDGKANEALVRFLAGILGIARGNVEIVRGETSRTKIIRIRGVTLAKLRTNLGIE